MIRCALPIPIVLLVALAGCGIKETSTTESDPYRDREEQSYSSSVSFGSLDRFEQAQRLEQERDYPGAIAIYRSVYQNSPDDEVKARALLEWARVERSAFNPDRDPDSAKARLELLLENYPDSEVAAEAAELLSASDD